MKAAKALREYLPDHTIVQVLVKRSAYEDWTQVNLGYVSEFSLSLTPSGQVTWKPVIPALHEKLKLQDLFIDMQEPGSQGQRLKDGKIMPDQKIEAAFTNFGETVKDVNSLSSLAERFWNNMIVNLMNVIQVGGEAMSFGGNPIVGNTGSLGPMIKFTPFKGEGYSEGFINTFQIMTQFTYGSCPNFFQILSSFATAPLYELFFDPLSGDGYAGGMVNGWTSSGEISQIEFEAGKYSVVSGSGALVFRPAPYSKLFDILGNWDPASDLPMQEIKGLKRISFDTHGDEIYSGVHVGLSTLGDDVTNAILFPVTWNPYLRAIYGQKVMQVKLDGIGFPKGAAGDLKRPIFIQALKSIQEMLYANFCQGGQRIPLRNSSASIDCVFDFYRVGMPITWPDPEPGFGSFGVYGYVQSVTDRLKASGEASTSIAVKWVDRLSTPGQDVVTPPGTVSVGAQGG
jgi:hypothetical protein